MKKTARKLALVLLSVVSSGCATKGPLYLMKPETRELVGPLEEGARILVTDGTNLPTSASRSTITLQTFHSPGSSTYHVVDPSREETAVHRALLTRIPYFQFRTHSVLSAIEIMNVAMAESQNHAHVTVWLDTDSLRFLDHIADPFPGGADRKGAPIDWLPLITMDMRDRPFLDTVRALSSVCGLTYRIEGARVRLYMENPSKELLNNGVEPNDAGAP